MKLLIQRVQEASVKVDGQLVGQIGRGVLVFVGITHTDTEKTSSWLANKLVNLRIFEDEQGKLNRSLLEVQGEALVVSQFTLYGSCEEGRRPSFIEAAPPGISEPLYEHFVQEVKSSGLKVGTGIFGAMMQVALVNDGPITLIIEKS